MLSFQLVRVYAATAALLAGICACTKPNPLVCCASRVDCQSIGADADQRTCASDLVCIDHMCVQPQCTINTDCPSTTPFCAPDQTCVECLQSDQCPTGSPVCGSDGSCRACASDDECASAVCDAGTGTCVDAATIVYASTTGSDTADCTQTAPCSISRAFTVANVARDTIKLSPGFYTANITVNDRTLDVHGPGATVMSGSTTTSGTFTVNDRAHLRFFGLTIVNMMTGGSSADIGLDCESTDHVNFPSVSLEQVTLDAAFTPAYASECAFVATRSELHNRDATSSSFAFLLANGGSATIDRSLFTGGDGVVALTGLVTVTNSVISDQTGPSGALTGNGGAVHISFSTIYSSQIRCLSGTASCTGGTLKGVCIDNSIIDNVSAGAPTDTITGAACNVDHTLITPQATQRGTNNKFNLDPMFVNGPMGDFHLKAGSPAIGAADPAAQDAVDYDGNARAPQGSASDLGAFEYKP